MKKLIVILLMLPLVAVGQTEMKVDYQKGIQILHKTLNSYRADLNKMDSVCLKEKGGLPYTRKKASVDSLFPFVLDQKLCKEALKRCRYNLKVSKNSFGATHRYESFECNESIHIEGSSIGFFDFNKSLIDAITGLIIDIEPIVGHREMLLDENKKQRYVGFGYVITQKGSEIEVLVIVLTATIKGIQNPINFNNTYLDLSKGTVRNRKQLMEYQKTQQK